MHTVGNKLNRSCSESDLLKVNFDFDNSVGSCHGTAFGRQVPVLRKRYVFIEEVIHTVPPRYARSASCCEIDSSTADHLHNLENLFTTSVKLDNTLNDGDTIFISSLNTQLHKTIPESSSRVEKDSVVPMDVDTLPGILHNLKTKDCVDFIETMDVDIDNFIDERLTDVENIPRKRYFSEVPADTTFLWEQPLAANKVINTITRKSNPQLKKKKSYSSIYILVLVILFASVLLYIILAHLSVNNEIQLQYIQKDLLEKVYEQETPVNLVIRTLQQREHWKSKIKVLSFIGSTGVGKTFVANLVKKHFHPWLIHELYGIQLSYEAEWENILTGLKSCCLNLIIIDDLKKTDATDVFALIHSLPQNQFILVIAIFNIQYSNNRMNYSINYNDIVEIRNEFDNSEVYYEIIVFEEFNTDQVKDWIERQLVNQNLEFSLQQNVIRAILEGHQAKYEGLKGLHSKILLQLEKLNH